MIDKLLQIIVEIDNPYNYAEVAKLYKEQLGDSINIMHYYQKVGLVLGAKFNYPNLPIEEAYYKLLKDINSTSIANGKSQPCGNCNKQVSDGGRVV